MFTMVGKYAQPIDVPGVLFAVSSTRKVALYSGMGRRQRQHFVEALTSLVRNLPLVVMSIGIGID